MLLRERLQANCSWADRYAPGMRPDTERHVSGQWATQKQHHDAHAKERSLEVRTAVMAKDFRDPMVWKPGVVLEKRAPLSYLVKLRSGSIWRRHIDHLRELTGGLPTVDGDVSLQEAWQCPTSGSSETFSMVPSPEPVPELTGPERCYPVRLCTPVDRLTY